jgi:tRNA dimethylallyltransferase
MKTLVVVTGPTAVGKTSLCLKIAQYYSIPIINADSRQIYKEMKIGTASPTVQEQETVKHYFVNQLELDKYYNASMFEQDVIRLLDEQLFADSNIALMSGGSMMYIDAVCNGIDDIPTVDEETRAYLMRKYEQEGLDRLCEELRILDPEHYAEVDRKNARRVIHALEICYMTGRTYTSYRTKSRKERSFNLLKIGLNRPREELYERINLRVDNMIKKGLVDEARQLYGKRTYNALNTVGYKELFEYIDGNYSLEEAIERIKGNTRRYARKQLTWYKRDKDIRWFNPENEKEILNYISNIV